MKPIASVTVTTVVAVDPATAFAVFTAEIDAWWRRGPRFRFRLEGDGELRFEPGVGGRLVEVYGENDVYEVGPVRVWEPGTRLVFELRARQLATGETTEVEVRFVATAGGTRVTVEHRGFDRLPPDHPVRHGLDDTAFRDLMGVWWGDLAVALQRHVGQRSLHTAR